MKVSVVPAEMNHAIAERLRHAHGLTVTVMTLDGAPRRYDPATRSLTLSENLPRESCGFHMAFQLVMLEARDANPTSAEAAMLIRIGLLNYTAGALLMPYDAFLASARSLRRDMEAMASRFGVSFFFLRVDPAGNVSKRFAAAGYPFARYGGSCPRWVVHNAFAQPGSVLVQVAELPDGAAYLCFARAVTRPAGKWGEPKHVHVVAMGCAVTHAADVAYADGLDLERAKVGIGLSCRHCDRPDCRSRAFSPLQHRLSLDLALASATPYWFEAKRR